MKRFHKNTLAILFITLLVMGSSNLLRGQQFNHRVSQTFSYQEIRENQTIHLLRNKLDKAKSHTDTASTIENLVLLSAIERIHKNYSAAFDAAGEALFLSEQYSNDLLLAKSHEQVAILNYLYKQDDTTKKHFTTAHALQKKLYKKGQITSEEMFYSYYSKLMFAHRVVDMPIARCYLDSCKQIVRQHKLDPFYQLLLSEKQSIHLTKNGKLEQAIQMLLKTSKVLENYKKQQEHYYNAQSLLIVIYSSLANNYKNKGAIMSADYYYRKSLNQSDYFAEYTLFRSFVMEKYAETLSSMGRHAEAYKLVAKSKKIVDQYLNPRNDKSKDFLSIRNRYKEELQTQHKQITEQKLEIAEGKQHILRFRNYVVLLFLLLALLTFTFVMYWQQSKHKKENELNRINQQQTNDLLDHKNKELTATMLQLIEKEEIIKKLSEALDDTQANKALLSTIEKQSGNLWKAFNTRFIELNEDFYENLKAQVPGLSAADLKICALIKLNFSGKEMAYLLGISEGSVNVARHRLRKKMSLERDTNLAEFIHSI